MSYYKKIIGKKCYLSPMSLDDIEKYCSWLNDMEISITLDTPSKVFSSVFEKQFIEKALKDGEQIYGIVDLNTDQLIGNCGLLYIDHINRSAEFGIFIGDKAYWGKGYGKESTLLILDHGFNVLNLNNIMLRVYEYNTNAVKLYEKCGFKTIGKRREAKIIAGKKYDIIYMDILSSDFKSVYINNLIK